jgi:predicted  nucleic acid-binding Zn-ribbon protein
LYNVCSVVVLLFAENERQLEKLTNELKEEKQRCRLIEQQVNSLQEEMAESKAQKEALEKVSPQSASFLLLHCINVLVDND